MNEHTYTVLEFHAFLELLATYAQTAAGHEILRGIRPAVELSQITARRGLYGDLMKLHESVQSFPSLFLEDISALLRETAPEGAVVPGVELLPCRVNLDITREVAAFLSREEFSALTNLQRLCAPLNPCEELRAALMRCLDSDGSVLDNATPRLRELRQACGRTEQRIRRTLEGMVRSSELAGASQEKFVTMRNGRYVIPIKREAHSALRGIVHDISQTGQTEFIEPEATLPLGNELARLRAEEKDEVRRILAVLSGMVRRYADNLRENQRVIAQLDAGQAVARWAVAYQCAMVTFGGIVRIKQARHPLLWAQFRKRGAGEEVVPLDLDVTKDIRALVITGSNTGGKTIALKTLGLLALIAQCGMPIPAAPDTQLPVYENILADIGDEQSIEANLSTFSGHLATIADIIRQTVRGPSLILLDELGSGTDPLEGGAIACGVLETLAKRHALTVATTHLGMVKTYVHEQPRMLNASVRFDLESLRPLYILDVGRPGASHALHIAKRIGMPPEVLSKAQSMMSGEQLRLEDMLSKMEADQKALAEQSRQVKQANAELMEQRAQLREELSKLKTERKKRINDAYREAEAIVDNTRAEMENLIRQLREAAPTGATVVTPAVQEVEATVRRELAEKKRKASEGARNTAVRNARPVEKGALKVGKRVWVEKLQAHGRIESIGDHGRSVTVSVDGVPFVMKAAELQQPTEADSTLAASRQPVIKVAAIVSKRQSRSEINLVGYRVADALVELDQFLEDAVVSRLEEVRIVHGFGTGQLRNGIHQWLARHPSVAEFRLGREHEDNGGGGCTIVRLVR